MKLTRLKVQIIWYLLICSLTVFFFFKKSYRIVNIHNECYKKIIDYIKSKKKEIENKKDKKLLL